MNNLIETVNISTLEKVSENNAKIKDLFIFAIGYENRSIFLYNKYVKNKDIPKLCFLFEDYNQYRSARENKKKVEENNISPVVVGYDEEDIFLNRISDRYNELKKNTDKINIHIDYSSMPRSWYCKIPYLVDNILHDNDTTYLWYSEGVYQKKAEEWPSAGIEEVEVFQGKPSLRPQNNRSHILGLGFDSIRSQAILSVLDPSFFVVSYSYPTYYETMQNVIYSKNKYIIDSAAFSIELPTEDFTFSLSKLYETVKELYDIGDVILVPDGPKPQILATSLIPQMFNKSGVVCLHIKRHKKYFKAVDVKAKGGVFGFLYSPSKQS